LPLVWVLGVVSSVMVPLLAGAVSSKASCTHRAGAAPGGEARYWRLGPDWLNTAPSGGHERIYLSVS
jgi:hypothetical protein